MRATALLLLAALGCTAPDRRPPRAPEPAPAEARPREPAAAAADLPTEPDPAGPLAAAPPDVPAEAEPLEGAWCAELASPGGPLRFGLVLARDGARWKARVENGAETIDVGAVEVGGGEVELSFPHYDARIVAGVDARGARLEGAWTKTSSGGRASSLPFAARHVGEAAAGGPRCGPREPARSPERFAGRFAVRFASAPDDPAVGVVELDGAVARGTFLTSTGDHRFLAGAVEGDRLVLAAFDGAHAFLYAAAAREDGSLAGDFWSGDRWHDAWTAVRDAGAAPADPYALVRSRPELPLASLVFSDLDGRARSLAEPAFAGRAVVLQVLGSWCPNCHDETAWLAPLERRLRARGLSVVGLAFEYVDDLERASAQVRRMRERHGAEYPVLIAGLADKGRAAAALPALERVLAFPTTLLLSGDGRVAAVHTGFAGPATGDEHARTTAELERRIEALLEEPAREADPAIVSLLLSDAWRDRRDGLFVHFEPSGGVLRFDAREALRFDRPASLEPVRRGTVAISGSSVVLCDEGGGACDAWTLDARAGVMLDARDAGHRLTPAARATVPVVDGRGISEPGDLLAALGDADARVRREAVYWLAVQQQEEMLERPFDPRAQLEDADPEVRATAAWAAGALGAGDARARLVALLGEPHPFVRRAAARALAALGGDAALDARRGDLDPVVREVANAPPVVREEGPGEPR